MTTLLKVWVVNPEKPLVQPRFDPIPRHVNVRDFDSMEKQARHILELADYKIQSLNHGTDGCMVAYVYPKHLKVAQAKMVPGWVFKRSNVPPTTK